MQQPFCISTENSAEFIFFTVMGAHMSGDSTKGISSPFRGSILDRVQPHTQNKTFSAVQSEVDQLVGSGMATVSDEKMMASLFAAGLTGRFIRLGTVAASGRSLAPLVQAFSHVTALAGESAVFAGMERRFAAWEGHAPTQAFQKDWARAAINLGSIKLLGGATAGQNLITQHLLIDSAMVLGHHAGYVFGVTDKPQGSLSQQMIHAEGMNLGMKGSLALLHGFSPRLSAMERSVDLALKSQETGLFSKDSPIPFFSQPAMATEGGPEGFLASSRRSESLEGPSLVFVKGNEGGGSGPSRSVGRARPTRIEREFYFWIFSPTRDKWVKGTEPLNLEEILASHEPLARLCAVREAVNSKDPSLLSALEKALADVEPIVRITAAWALAAQGVSAGRQVLEKGLNPLEQPDPLLRAASAIILGRLGHPSSRSPLEAALNDPDAHVKEEATHALARVGVKSLELSDSLHTRAKKFVEEGEALHRRDSAQKEHYRRAMELEWSAALAVPARNERLRGDRYANAIWFAIKAERPEDVRKIILDALVDDFGAVAENKLKDSAKKLPFWNKDRKFILRTLDETKAYLKLFIALMPAPALATVEPHVIRLKSDPVVPRILMMSSEESDRGDASGVEPSTSSLATPPDAPKGKK